MKVEGHTVFNEFKDLAAYFHSRFDRIEREPVIMLEELQKPPFSDFSWTPQSSGIRIPDEIAAALEAQWSHRNTVPHFFPDQEIEEGIDYPEGATRTIHVNSYERNREARSACLAHYGAQCIVCGFIFANRYGDIAADFIEVHHLVPLSEIKNEYKVDPIRDLRPVCSNCHSVLHLRKPPYSIDELQRLIGLRASEEEHHG
jgi:5-methylcytosine-specific restriction protein A